MNQKLIFSLIAIVIIVSVVGFYSSKNSTNITKDNGSMSQDDNMLQDEKSIDDVMMDDTMTDKKDSMVDEKNDTTMMKAGSYESYSPEKIAMASSSHNVVLFFRASWCPTCISLNKDINANLGNIPENLTLLDVNYDNSKDLKKKYGVTYQHTLVQVDTNGNLIKKWSGSPTLASLVSEIK